MSFRNPDPGLVVDTTVTRVEYQDFYLISQFSHQGTVCPTHYNIIYNESGLSPTHQQKLAYKLCHAYYNWAGTVKVPAPVQYAHKLAYQVGENLGGNLPQDELCGKLHFL